MAQPAGPTTESEWTSRVVSGFAPLLTRPSDGDGAGYAVAAAHRVVRDAAGDPVLSLTLLLDGVPDPAEHDVTPRVRRGTLGVRVSLDAPVEALAATGLRPLYVRDGSTRMTAGESTELATAAVAGASSAASLSVSLDRDQTLAVLAALDGAGDDGITVASTLWYRAVEPPRRVHLTGSWAEVHDVLATQQGPPDLGRLFNDVLAQGVVRADPPDRPEAALPTFLSMARAVLLDRDGLLGPRPSPYFGLDIDARSSGTGVDRYLTVVTPLREVLGGCLAGRDRSRFISVVALSAEHDSATSDPVRRPRRVRSPRASRGDLDAAGRDPRFVQTADDRLVSTAARVGAVRPAAGVITAHLAEIVAAHHHWAVGLDDAADAGASEPDLPVVSDPQAATFPGRSGAAGWYAPSFTVVQPRPDQDASTSPFVFEFARTGTTLAGLPGLTATVTWRLRAAAPPGADGLRPIAVGDVGVVLDLPFRDAAGTDQRQRFPATVEWDGEDLVARVELLDDWARMAYGALSRPDFQTEPARVALTWSFTGCQRTAVRPNWVVSGGKTSLVPVVHDDAHPGGTNGVRPGPGPRPEQVYVDASTATLKTSAGDYRFRTGAVGGARGATVLVHAPLMAPTLRALRGPLVRPTIALEHLVEQPLLAHPERVTRLVQRTFLRGQTLDVLFPCDQLGACYVERRPEGLVAVGCRDTLQLGQTEWRQYEEITALTDPAYRVFRSLQQPGRFVVLPKRYVVARRRADEPEAWTPAILLYSLVDPDDTGDNHVVVDATLAPDVTPWAMASLRAALRGYAADPILTFATDVECTPTFTWTVVGIDGLSVAASLVDGGVRVGIQSDLNHALLLRDMLEHSGLPGAVTLRLPDGTEMRSTLQVDLRAQAGPQPKGPVELSATGRHITAVNRIGRRVDLAALRIDGGTSTLTDHPVETSLAPGTATTVTLPGDGAIDLDRCWPVYTVPDLDPAELPEIRSYVEDIRMNVVFLDLVDHPSRGVTRLDVTAQLAGAGDPQPVAMSGDPAVGSAVFVLPLTTYLGARQVRYRVSVTGTDGTTRPSDWLQHDVASGGSLIALGWESLGLG